MSFFSPASDGPTARSLHYYYPMLGAEKIVTVFFAATHTHTYVSEDGHGRIYIKQNFSSSSSLLCIFYVCIFKTISENYRNI